MGENCLQCDDRNNKKNTIDSLLVCRLVPALHEQSSLLGVKWCELVAKQTKVSKWKLQLIGYIWKQSIGVLRVALFGPNCEPGLPSGSCLPLVRLAARLANLPPQPPPPPLLQLANEPFWEPCRQLAATTAAGFSA